jgi:hypothetical protein
MSDGYRDAPLGDRPESLADYPPSRRLLLPMEDLGDPGRVAVFDAYVLMDNVREAVKAWEDAISGPGLLGN